MRWRFGKRNNQVKVAWLFKAKGMIWRLLPTTDGYFVGEDRTLDNKKTTFFCIDQKSGEVRWQNVSFGEDWWISLEVIHDDIVFLHEYAVPSMPEHKKIFALSLPTGKLLWSNDTLKFEFVAGEHVYASRETFEARIFFELDVRTGAVLRELESGYINVIREITPSSVAPIEFPTIFDPSNSHDVPLTDLITKATAGANNIAQVEYLEKNKVLLVVYYDNISANPTEQLLKQNIVIVGREKADILYRDSMSEQATTPVPDLFFGSGDFAYYIQDKKNLKAVNLSATRN